MHCPEVHRAFVGHATLTHTSRQLQDDSNALLPEPRVCTSALDWCCHRKRRLDSFHAESPLLVKLDLPYTRLPDCDCSFDYTRESEHSERVDSIRVLLLASRQAIQAREFQCQLR